MTWSYSGDPATSKKDEVRFLIGDTNEQEPLLLDEEITYLLTTEPSAKHAAPFAARAIAGKFSRQADKEVGDLRVSLSQKAKAYHQMADNLRADAQVVPPPTTAGGVPLAAPLSGTSGGTGAFSRGMMSR